MSHDLLVLLLVEDDELDREIVLSVIQGHEPPVRCLVAKSGHEAIAILEGERPDVILCDINMPGMDGFELLTHVKQEGICADSLFVMWSTSGTPEAKEKSEALGASRFVEKPSRLRALRSLVASLLEPVADASTT